VSDPNPYSPPRADDSPAAPPAASAPLDGPSGIGGWLLLPLFGLIVTPFRIVLGTGRDLVGAFKPEVWDALTTPGAPAYHPLWGPLIVSEAVWNTALVAFTLVLLVLFFRKHHLVPKLMIGLMLAQIVMLIVDEALSAQIPAVESKGQGASDVMRSCIAALIWIPYFLRSRRVRNTFVRREPQLNV
jgi:hypothetical protein